jgi:hypothetical protein
METFGIIGKMNNTHYFIHHVTKHKQCENAIFQKLYDFLTHDGIIQNLNEKIIIYSMDLYDNNFNIISVQHKYDKFLIKQYDIQKLSELFVFFWNNYSVIDKNITFSYNLNIFEKLNNVIYAKNTELTQSPPFHNVLFLKTDYIGAIKTP